MNLRLRHLISRQTLNKLTRITSSSSSSSAIFVAHNNHTQNQLKTPPFLPTQIKTFHSSPQLNHSLSTAVVDDEEDEDEAAMNEFLSRFVHNMRGKLNESYPDCDKPTIDAMLLVIVEKLVSEMEKGGNLEEKLVSGNGDFSEDLWKTVWDVSNNVYLEMEREKKKEKMKKFLQSEEVKSMARFASEVGVRGDMLHELRFKWAREAMEKAEFYEGLERAGEAGKEGELGKAEAGAGAGAEVVEDSFVGNDDGGLPKRHGKIKYKLYGLDLSGSMWKEAAEKVHEAGEVISPQEAKSITGKCKLVTEKILGLGKQDDFGTVVSPLLDEWKELLQPNRVDWISLLQRIKERDGSMYIKVMEHVLDEPSFQANIRDYSKLIDIYAEENRSEDIERILKKMSESGMEPDIVILTALLHMYSKGNNVEQANAAYEALKSQGFKPDMEVYNSMIMMYVNAGKPKMGETLMREMELRDMKPTEDIYMALLRAFAKNGDSIGAQRIVNTMQFAGFQQTAESCALLLEACVKSGNPSEARNCFNEMMNLGFKPDDRCTAYMISAYEKKNELGKALYLLLQLEKGGFEPGVSTYSVLVDWLGKLQLIDEAEQMLTKIAQLGEAPPFKIQVSLCDMYARAKMEKKALQALGVLEAKKDLLEYQDFERIIQALLKGDFVQDAQRMYKLMEGQGFDPSYDLQMRFMAIQSFGGKSAGSKRPGLR
ncbi:pentatricopeptide repeat-containing protein At1g12775, mitochondrial-like [Chenopodium quinoa]|uniref:pentatricopeptide repeat-containing protein At1g12775, mitochondrial-like n=1 Tax=Chenopodium quinoa TaxID=63459 RepID=UPI000B774B7E|nr:pentatricopeptide repeat-containing protein At1g12775, mitochondrial-like [Chenopodium quinoa]